MGYIFLSAEKALVPIEKDQPEYVLAVANYGINKRENLYRYLVEQLWVEAMKNGHRTEVYRLAHYDASTNTHYLNRFDNRVIKTTVGTIETVDNGTDGVLFIADSTAEPFELVEFDSKQSPLDELVVSKLNFATDTMSPSERAIAFTIWFHCIFFPELMSDKPILAFVGEKGSGKSTALKLAGFVVYGSDFDVTPLPNEQRDFDAIVSNSAYVAFDNADSRCNWLNDRLAIVATGSTLSTRKLYSDNTRVNHKMRCFLGLTSRTPHFRRDDIADRTLIMSVARVDNYLSPNSLKAAVLSNRDKIMTELVHGIQEILCSIRDHPETVNIGSFRMVEYAIMSVRVGKSLGAEDDIRGILKKLEEVQTTFTLEAEPVIDLLDEWIAENAGIKVSTTKLCHGLKKMADEKGVVYGYDGKPNVLGRKLKELKFNLSQRYTVDDSKGQGGKQYWIFWPKEKVSAR